MKQIIKKLFGIDKIEAQAERSLAIAAEAAETAIKATAAAERAQQAEETAKQTPKERANKKGEPWVSVLDTHVNKDNIRNGFFELDWNDLFVLQLKQEGYGFDGDPDEEIVDRWFRDIVRNMLADEGQDVTRGVGYINVKPLTPGKSEVS
jgi:ssDNA-specific exonuclease RecJ